MQRIIADAGAIVALFDANDQFHSWAAAHSKQIHPPLWSCEAVIAESFHLLSKVPGGPERLVSALEREQIRPAFSLVDHLSAIVKLIRRYGDIPMSFADACLVRMAELDGNSVIFTTDSDFLIYRKNGRQSIPILFPRKGRAGG